MYQKSTIKCMLTLLALCTSFHLIAPNVALANSSLSILLHQIKEKSQKTSPDLFCQADDSLMLMQSIDQQFVVRKSYHQKIHEYYTQICDFFVAQDNEFVDLATIQPHDIRALSKKISECNTYIKTHTHPLTIDLFNKISKFNNLVVDCLDQAIAEQLDFVDHVVDYLVYRPIEFVSDNKLLTACCASMVIAGVAYYFYQPDNTNQGVPAVNPHPGQNMRGITLVRGDITQQIFDDQNHAAIVNAAQPIMLGGAGIDGAIHRAAGPGLRDECALVPADAHGERCPVGQARITGGHNLAPLRIIHTVGPNTHIPAQNANRAVLLDNAYQNSLDLARDHGIRYIALPSISTGIYGYPIDQAASIAVDAAIRQQANNPLEEIRFVTFNQNDFNAYRQILERHGWHE